ncbi:hypothetical protein AB205_0214810 [Aquarana catesbeiana]|uniref:Uncharacterized protein n=1 Tax=Aquarana catesbeiana TaxID=8400 RepID=A0A2G9Q7E3_AQUCT|nr:hypothetical protein AB205_0214810 [Aquarana catesbeiana]
MTGRPTRRGRQSQANKRGQAGSVSRDTSAGRGDSASSSAPSHVETQHAEDLVQWMTKPSSSSPSSLIQAQGTGKSAANVASSLGSMASVTPSIAPPCPPEDSLELFDHSVGYMHQEDAQRLEGSDDCTQLEEGSNVSPERGGAQEGQQSGSHVSPAEACCQVCSSDEEGGDDEVTDSMWVPDRREEEEEEEAHLQRGRMPSRGQLKGSTLTASHRRAPHVQGTAVSARYSKSSLVWAFFEMLGHHMLDQTYVDLPCSSLASVPKRPTPKNKADLSLRLISWDLQPHYTSRPLRNLH